MIYIAYSNGEGKKPRAKFASTSIKGIRKFLAAWPNSKWQIALYKLPWNQAQVAQAVVDPTQLEAESVTTLRVNEHGRVWRKRHRKKTS